MKLTIVSSLKKGLESPVLRGQIAIWLITIFGTLFTAILLKSETISSTNLSTCTYITSGIGLISGGFIAGRKAGGNGWLNGLLQGLLYVMMLFAISFLAFDSSPSISFWLLTLIVCSITTLSGVVGVNTSK